MWPPYCDASRPIIPPFGTDTLDTCVTLVARSSLEARTAVVAAAALAALAGGVVL